MTQHSSNLAETSQQTVPALQRLARDPARSGYQHTLQEICQQPDTWVESSECAVQNGDTLRHAVFGEGNPARAVLLTGSGSSLFIGESLAPALQRQLGIPVVSAGGDRLLIEGKHTLPPCPPSLIVSFARSGDSPESCGAVDLMLENAPECRHLAVTCNRHGQLATRYRDRREVATLVLPDRTCDRSLVMTSSFTSMLLAAHFLGHLNDQEGYVALAGQLASTARRFLLEHTEALSRAATTEFRSAVYLGSACRFGSARESALKMLEMTAGHVRTFSETYLGLRHGPMSAVHDDTLVVCFLSSDPLARAYEADVIEELNQKKLGAMRVVVGENIPPDLMRPGDLALECPGLSAVGDDASPVIDVLAGQWLGFFRCLQEGLNPDAPSNSGAISRVVGSFRIHHRGPRGIS